MNWLLDLLFPRKCLVCGAVGSWACFSCMQKTNVWWLPVTSLGFETRAVYAFEDGLVRELLHNLKYSSIWEAGEVLVDIAFEKLVEKGCPPEEIRAWCGEHVVLVPVPTSKARQKKRGYNQAEILARCLGEWLDVPVWTGALVRKKTKTLVGKAAIERLATVGSSFGWLGAGADLYAGRTIILVDDVCTTGVTLAACAAVVQEHWQGEVKGVVVAKKS